MTILSCTAPIRCGRRIDWCHQGAETLIHGLEPLQHDGQLTFCASLCIGKPLLLGADFLQLPAMLGPQRVDLGVEMRAKIGKAIHDVSRAWLRHDSPPALNISPLTPRVHGRTIRAGVERLSFWKRLRNLDRDGSSDKAVAAVPERRSRVSSSLPGSAWVCPGRFNAPKAMRAQSDLAPVQRPP